MQAEKHRFVASCFCSTASTPSLRQFLDPQLRKTSVHFTRFIRPRRGPVEDTKRAGEAARDPEDRVHSARVGERAPRVDAWRSREEAAALGF